MSKINLGDKVKDTITGFTGIAVAKTLWINGCTRINVQPEGLNKDGKAFEPDTFDEPLLKVLKAKKAPEGDHDKGGPRPNVYQVKDIEKF